MNRLGFDLREEYPGLFFVGVRIGMGMLWVRRSWTGHLSVHELGKLPKSGEGLAYRLVAGTLLTHGLDHASQQCVLALERIFSFEFHDNFGSFL